MGDSASPSSPSPTPERKSLVIKRRTVLSIVPLSLLGGVIGRIPTVAAADGWTPARIVPQLRPSGPGYVRWESLYRTGDTLRDVVYRVPLDSDGQPQALTLPGGLFEINGFNDGYFDGIRIGQGGAAGCRG